MTERTFTVVEKGGVPILRDAAGDERDAWLRLKLGDTVVYKESVGGATLEILVNGRTVLLYDVDAKRYHYPQLEAEGRICRACGAFVDPTRPQPSHICVPQVRGAISPP